MEYIITSMQLAKLESGKAKERKEIRGQIMQSAFSAGEVVKVGTVLKRMAPLERDLAIERGRS